MKKVFYILVFTISFVALETQATDQGGPWSIEGSVVNGKDSWSFEVIPYSSKVKVKVIIYPPIKTQLITEKHALEMNDLQAQCVLQLKRPSGTWTGLKWNGVPFGPNAVRAAQLWVFADLKDAIFNEKLKVCVPKLPIPP